MGWAFLAFDSLPLALYRSNRYLCIIFLFTVQKLRVAFRGEGLQIDTLGVALDGRDVS
jgi:hypothetical protein